MTTGGSGPDPYDLAPGEAAPRPPRRPDPTPLDDSLPVPTVRPRPTYRITRQVYLRLLGLVYLIAFLSLWVQIDGLIGSHGLLPVRDWLDRVRQVDPHAYSDVPTLVWLRPTDGFLHVLCGAGVALSLLVMLGIAQ